MTRRYGLVLVAVAGLGLLLAGCGGSPTSPSSVGAGVNLHGVALGDSTSATSTPGFHAMSGSSGITVTVDGTSISTKISGNGTFELKGLPPGGFTLTFTSNGVTLGTITISNVPTQAEIDVVIHITTTVTLVKVEINGTDTTADNDATKTCVIQGGRVNEEIELEGDVKSATSGSKTFQIAVNGERGEGGTVTVDASKATFDCAGVKGTCDATLLVTGAKVHVRGTLNSCTTTTAMVTASEVKFQH
jgi:hypothetical protein